MVEGPLEAELDALHLTRRWLRLAMAIDPDRDWRACTGEIWCHCDVLDTVTLGDDPPGLLCHLHATGSYVRVLDGLAKVLQRAIARQNPAACMRAGVGSRWWQPMSGQTTENGILLNETNTPATYE